MFITNQIEQFVTNNNPESKNFYTKLYKLLFKSKILQETHYRCIYCSKLATTLDHIIPKNKCGQSLQSNLVAACQSCNISKGTNYWKDWYKEKSFYNEQSANYICNKLKTNKRS
jgi:5-methylcytosine-specific restriction endonuclease McrA